MRDQIKVDEEGRTFGTHCTEKKCLDCLVRRRTGKTILALATLYR